MTVRYPEPGETLGPDRDGEAGFTLVEALVAFMIVALALTMGLRILVNGALWARRGPAAAERLEEAASIVDGLIGGGHVRPGSTTGRFAQGEPWRVEITDVTGIVLPKSQARLMRIEFFDNGETGGKALLATLASGG